jgi:hypothetical protein
MDQSQAAICRRVGVECQPSEQNLKLGLALATLGQQPINGLRHPAEDDATGWYIWAGGELSAADDFFQPVHVNHLAELLPQVIPYLGLPPGWRFLLAPGVEDLWFDEALLDLN